MPINGEVWRSFACHCNQIVFLQPLCWRSGVLIKWTYLFYIKKAQGKEHTHTQKTLNYQIHYSKDLAQVLPSEIFALMQKYPGAWEVKRKKQMKQTAAKERVSVILYLDFCT